jgi:hypothetical protein
VHACRARDLPWWVDDELWEAELAGEVVAFPHKVAAPRGRLVRRIEAWTPTTRQAYAEACAWRTRDRALDAVRHATARDRLAGCSTLAALLETAQALTATAPSARVPLTMTADAAMTALGAAAATSAYIAAHAAGRAGGRDTMDAERRWQAAWLRERLALSEPD